MTLSANGRRLGRPPIRHPKTGDWPKYMQNYRADRIARGVCYVCGEAKPAQWSLKCARCRERNAQLKREARARRGSP